MYFLLTHNHKTGTLYCELGVSPYRVVMGGDSFSRGHGFENKVKKRPGFVHFLDVIHQGKLIRRLQHNIFSSSGPGFS